jgi:hypothetical protein
VGELESVALTDPWALREIDLVARDFDTLPLTARLLVEHLRSRAETAEPSAEPMLAAE